MILLWGVRDGGKVLRSGERRTDDGEPIVARVQPRSLAAGIGREASWGPLWVVIRHSMRCELTVTPILDGELLDDLEVTHTLDTPPAPRDVPVKVYLSRPDDPEDPFSRQALRGTWFSVRLELEALESGDVLALGGIEVDVRPLGWARGAINAGG